MILIIGKSDLSKSLIDKLEDVTVVGRPEYNFSLKEDCDRLVNMYNPDIIINTLGSLNNEIWNSLTVNFVTGVYLTLSFYNKLSKAHIINISSASTFWVSYPGISDERLIYNLAKESLSNFNRHFNRKIIDENKKDVLISTIEPGAFPSKMNGHSGSIEIEKIAALVKNTIENPVQHVSMIK